LASIKTALEDYLDRQRSRVAFWTNVGRVSRLLLFGGVFAIFATLGCLTLLMRTTRVDPLYALVIIVSSGAFAVLYAALSLHGMFPWIPVAIVFQFLFSSGMARLLRESSQVLDNRVLAKQLDVLGAIATVCSAVAYATFFTFVSREGRMSFRVHTEMALAAEIHRALVPPFHRNCGPFEIYGCSVPSGEVGGDLVDFTQIGDGWSAYVADVSGHGVSSGVLMAMFKTAVRTCAEAQDAPQSIFAQVNRVLYPLKTPNMYITAGFLSYRPAHGVTLCLAGHPALKHYQKKSGNVRDYPSPNLPLGIVADQVLAAEPVVCAPGDILLLMTDGFTEVFNKQGREMGSDPLVAALRDSAASPLPNIFNRLRDVSLRFGKQEDDQTLLLVRYTG